MVSSLTPYVDKLSNEVETQSSGIYRYQINTRENSQEIQNNKVGVKNTKVFAAFDLDRK